MFCYVKMLDVFIIYFLIKGAVDRDVGYRIVLYMTSLIS